MHEIREYVLAVRPDPGGRTAIGEVGNGPANPRSWPMPRPRPQSRAADPRPARITPQLHRPRADLEPPRPGVVH